MPKITLKDPLVWYEQGYSRREYPAGEVDVSDECAEVALREGWAEASESQPTGGDPTDAPAADSNTQPAEDAATPAAPENKDAAPRRARKG